MKLECVVLGKVTSEEAVVAVTTRKRLTNAESLVLDYCESGASLNDAVATRTVAGRFVGQGDQSDGHHVYFRIQGLREDTSYQYRLRRTEERHTVQIKAAKGEPGPRELGVRTFKTAPGAKSKGRVKFIVSGDQEELSLLGAEFFDVRDITAEIYREIASRKPDLFIHLGDHLWSESEPARWLIRRLGREANAMVTLTAFREAILRDFMKTARAVLSEIPAFRVLDDHDYGRNNFFGDDLEDPEELARVRSCLYAFEEFWPVPEGPKLDPAEADRGDANGCALYYQVRWGNVGFWCLNLRQHSTAESDEEYRLLGRGQYEWLAKSLTAVDAPKTKFIVSALPFTFGKTPDGDKKDEDFRGSLKEWTKLLTLFAAANVSALFTADSHNYSRCHLQVAHNGEWITIPHYVVGTMGGKPNVAGSDEPRLPTGVTAEHGFRVDRQPGAQARFPPVPRSVPQAGELGQSKPAARFGFLEVTVDLLNGEFSTTQYFTDRHGAGFVPFDAEQRYLIPPANSSTPRQ